MDGPTLWQVINVLWGALFALLFFIGKYIWDTLHNHIAKVGRMELDSAREHVTKEMMEIALAKFAREYITPLHKDLRATLRALDEKGIHVPRHLD